MDIPGLSEEDVNNSLISVLDDNKNESVEAIRLFENVKYDGNLNDLAGAFTLTGNNSESIGIEYQQDNEVVAIVKTGVDIIATSEKDDYANIGIGGEVTELHLLEGKTLNLDVGDDQASVGVLISGEGSIVYTKDDQDQASDVSITITNADNTYQGTTTVENGVWLRVTNSGGLGDTSWLNINDVSKVTLESTVGSFEQEVGGLTIEEGAELELAATDYTTHLHIRAASDNNEIKGALSGDEKATLWLDEGAQLKIADSANLVSYDGSFGISEGAVLEYEVLDGVKTFSNSLMGEGFLKKTDSGEMIIDESVEFIKLEAAEGTVRFSSNAETDQYIDMLILNSDATIEIGADSSSAKARAWTETDGVLVVQDFVGNGGIIAMDVTLGTATEKGATVEFGTNGNDGLEIQGTASGSASILIRDKNRLKQGAEERIHLVKVNASTEDFNLSLYNGAVTAGAYDYTLVREDRSASGDEVETGNDWYLSSIEGQDNIRNTTVNAGSYIAIASAAQLFDVSLRDRVGNRDWINPVTGEKQSTSFWVRQMFNHERSRDSTNQIRMRNSSSVTMVGGDIVQWTTSGNGLAYAGVMGSIGKMDTKSRSHRTNLRSDADTDAWGAGVYFGWKANSDAFTGPYVDGWVMFTHADSTVEGTDIYEDVKGEGLSASIEVGWGFHVGSVKTDNGKTADFHVEPHVSATWFGMNYDDISNDAHDVTFEGHNNVRTRLGARLMISERETKNFNVYTEVNWVHNTQEYGATISGLSVDQAGARNQGEARLGADWRVSDRLSVWARAGASVGDDGYNEREGSVGIRYKF